MAEMFYAGVGSRETPSAVCAQMTALARKLARLGWSLRSGGAEGADSAFETGAQGKQIFRASAATPEAIALAAKYHPAWGRCSPFAKKLHARNGFQVLGPDLMSPSLFVACWTKDGGPTGGTGQALRVAAAYSIPVFNLYFADAERRLIDTLPALVGHDIFG